jgi:hypothetical protein
MESISICSITMDRSKSPESPFNSPRQSNRKLPGAHRRNKVSRASGPHHHLFAIHRLRDETIGHRRPATDRHLAVTDHLRLSMQEMGRHLHSDEAIDLPHPTGNHRKIVADLERPTISGHLLNAVPRHHHGDCRVSSASAHPEPLE